MLLGVWLDKSIVRKYTYCILTQHEMRTNLVHTHFFLGFLMSLVIWKRRVKTIGCLSLKGKAEFSSHPPTLTVPCSSIDHRSLIIGSNLDRELLHLILAFHSLRLRLNSWTLSVTILLIYAFPFLVVQLLWWWLSSTCSSWKFLSYNLSIWLRETTRTRLLQIGVWNSSNYFYDSLN